MVLGVGEPGRAQGRLTLLRGLLVLLMLRSLDPRQ